MIRASSYAGNIPIDLLKTLVLIADLGSVTRAARELGISQSAVSAQIRRLEALVSGRVFVKQGRGVQLSELGQLIASYARRIVAMSDQLQAMVGTGARKTQLRVGLSRGIDALVLADVLEILSSELGENPVINCDTSANLLRALDSGFVDAAFLTDTTPASATAAAAWNEPWYWIKAPNFLLSPGAPVPLVCWPGSLTDRVAVPALRQAGIEYSVAFTSADRSLRKAAVLAGLGFMPVSQRSVEASNLHIAREYYLPSLPDVHAGVYLSDGLDGRRKEIALQVLQSVLRPANAESRSENRR